MSAAAGDEMKKTTDMTFAEMATELDKLRNVKAPLCRKCDGVGKVRGYYDPHTRSAFVEVACPDCLVGKGR